MTIAMNEEQGARVAPATAYTVISKSGQRGIEYRDPQLAVLAFWSASAADAPFVLRHQGTSTHVIALVRAGVKEVEAGCVDVAFRAAYEAVTQTVELSA